MPAASSPLASRASTHAGNLARIIAVRCRASSRPGGDLQTQFVSFAPSLFEFVLKLTNHRGQFSARGSQVARDFIDDLFVFTETLVSVDAGHGANAPGLSAATISRLK